MMAPVALRLSRSTACGDLLRHLGPAAAAEQPEDRRLPQPRERLAELRLEHHQRREDPVGEGHAEEVGDHRQLEQEGDEVDDRQHQQPEDDLERARADQEAQQRVDDVRDDQDLEQVPPARRGERQLPERHYGPPMA